MVAYQEHDGDETEIRNMPEVTNKDRHGISFSSGLVSIILFLSERMMRLLEQA